MWMPMLWIPSAARKKVMAIASCGPGYCMICCLRVLFDSVFVCSRPFSCRGISSQVPPQAGVAERYTRLSQKLVRFCRGLNSLQKASQRALHRKPALVSRGDKHMLIHGAIEEYLAAKRNSITHDTYAWYTHYLDLFGTWCTSQHLSDLSSLTPGTVQQFVAASRTTNTHTRHARAQIVKGFLAWCAQDDELGVRSRTVRRIEMPKVEQSEIELFSDEDIRRLFRACDLMHHPHRNLVH